MEYFIDPIAAEVATAIRVICERHRIYFDESVGIPLLDESQRVSLMWDSLLLASEQSSKKQLFVVFINQRNTDSREVFASNLETLDYFSVPYEFSFSLNPLGKDFLLLVNGTLEKFYLKESEGVGRARKVPADICLALLKSGILRTDLHRQTDADVVVPLDYFNVSLEKNEIAATYAYRHVQGELDEADFKNLIQYEKWLESYSRGLEYAGSPYAYWALGSTLFFRLSAYEKIRGIPNVRAGEDFHFLAKLRKLGVIKRLEKPVLEIRGRHSTRVPFGTGRALESMSEQKKVYPLYPQEIFESLKNVLISLNALAEHKSFDRFYSELDVLSLEFFKDFEKSFSKILAQGSSVEQKKKLLHENFDALATLRWVNQRYSTAS